jgi:hypothetical protein
MLSMPRKAMLQRGYPVMTSLPAPLAALPSAFMRGRASAINRSTEPLAELAALALVWAAVAWLAWPLPSPPAA